jgi:AAA ATPase domain
VPFGQVRRILDQVVAERTAAAIAVLGDRGIGKTAFLDAVVSEAADRGFSIGLSTGAPVVSTPMATLFSALRSGRAPLLSQEHFDDLGRLHDRQLWLVDRLAGVLESLATHKPLLVAFDDFHSADPLSVFALRILAGRLAGLPVVWLFAGDQTPDGPLAADANVVDSAVELSTIRLRPLTDTAVHDLAADHVGGKIDPGLRTQLVGAAGFPWLAVALVDGHGDHGRYRTDQLIVPVHPQHDRGRSAHHGDRLPSWFDDAALGAARLRHRDSVVRIQRVIADGRARSLVRQDDVHPRSLIAQPGDRLIE